MTPQQMNHDRIRRFLAPLLALTLILPAVAQQTTTPTDKEKAAAAEKEKTLELSPFVVSTTKDAGYFAENTLMGSRLNSNLADLAASITIVNKQQLEDTASVDINDVFRYEANTEGASSYTPFSVSRGIVRDSIGGWSNDVNGGAQGIATANRVRGLGAADTSENNYPTISRLLFDSYNTNSVEISRGPNSMLFGTGGASGIVNQSPSEAVLGKANTSVSMRYGSFDAWRASFNTNIPVGDKFAVFLAGLYDSKGFERKPSSDIYRRQYIAMTFQPFKKTKITGSYEHYDNYNNRPNYMTPSDYVSEWISQGKPGWNPVTQMITYANGTTKGPYLMDTRDTRYVSAAVTPLGNSQINTTTSPLYAASLQFDGRPTRVMYEDGKVFDYWVDSPLIGSTGIWSAPAVGARTQAQWVVASERLTSTQARQSPLPPASSGATAYASWSEVGVTNQSIYDWTKYNIQGGNYGNQDGKTINIELQQELLPNLNFNAGWFRQEMTETYTYGLGQANDATRLYVDTNTNLLNGQPNPHYGALFNRDYQVDSFSNPEKNNNIRAMLAYELNLSDNNGWTRFFGHHRFLALGSEQKQWSNDLRYRMSFDGGDPRFLPTTAALTAAGNSRNSWAGNAANIASYYYVGGSAASPAVTKGITNPFNGFGGVNTAKLNFYDWTTQTYATADEHFDPNLFYAGGGFGVTTRKTKSSSFSWQGFLWDNRLLPTFGWRRDSVTIRSNDRTGLTNADLYLNGYGVLGFDERLGTPLDIAGTTKTIGGVMRLFSGWASIDRKAESGSVVADFVRNLGIHYNKSDNFNAPATIQTDFFGNRLPVPSGTGKDYGIGGNVLGNKLVFRLNWYTASNEHAPSAAGSTPAGRAARIDTSSGRDWARQVVRIRNGQNPTSPDFDNNTVFPLTGAMQDQIAALQGLPFSWPDGRNIQTTESNVSKGKELQMTYNPTNNWTMKLTVGQQKASYSNAIGELQDWINYRMPLWKALVAPDMAPVYIRSNGNPLRLQSYWTGTGFSGDANSTPGNTTPTPEATFAGIVAPEFYRLKGLQNTDAPNLRQWSWSYLTNYTFKSNSILKGFSVGGNVRWADKAIAGYYGLLDPSTYTRYAYTTNVTIVYPDLNKPISTPSEINADVWVGYTRKIFSDKVRMKIQLNVKDVNKGGGLSAVQFNMDGSPSAFRIIDPRQYYLSTTFDF